MKQILKMVRYQKYTKRNKNWGFLNGGLPQTGPPKFKLFNHTRWTHEIFRVGEYTQTFSQRGLSKTQTFKPFKMDTWNGGPQIFNFRIWSNLCISAPSASFERCFSSAVLTASEFRMQLSGEHLKALNVMDCNKPQL